MNRYANNTLMLLRIKTVLAEGKTVSIDEDSDFSSGGTGESCIWAAL
jgi:hypothetical protein